MSRIDQTINIMRFGLFLGLLSLFGVGCATKSTAPAISTNAETAANFIEPAALILRSPGTTRFVTAQPDTVRSLLISRTQTPNDAGETWLITREITPSDGKHNTMRIQTWVRNTDGSIALTREENFVESVIVVFDPPMVIYPARLERTSTATQPATPTDSTTSTSEPSPSTPATPPPGFTQTTFVTVHPMNDPTKVRVKGPATQHIWYEGEEAPPLATTTTNNSTQTPRSHTTPASRLRSRCEIDFGVSRSINETVEWLRPNAGVIHEWRHERAFALAVKLRDQLEQWTLETPQ